MNRLYELISFEIKHSIVTGAVKEYRPETPKITKKLHAGKAMKSYLKGLMHQFKTELILIAQHTPQYDLTGVKF